MTNNKFQITNFQALLFAYPRELLHPAQPSTEGRKYTLVFFLCMVYMSMIIKGWKWYLKDDKHDDNDDNDDDDNDHRK